MVLGAGTTPHFPVAATRKPALSRVPAAGALVARCGCSTRVARHLVDDPSCQLGEEVCGCGVLEDAADEVGVGVVPVEDQALEGGVEDVGEIVLGVGLGGLLNLGVLGGVLEALLDPDLVGVGEVARDRVTTIALARPPIRPAVWARKCSTMISARWAMLLGCRDANRASNAAALRLSTSRSELSDDDVAPPGAVCVSL